MRTLNIKAAVAIAGLTAGLAAAVPVAASAATATTDPSVTGPAAQGNTPRHVTLAVDTVSADFHGKAANGQVAGTCEVSHYFQQGQAVVFRFWGTAANGLPLEGPNSKTVGNVKSASVKIQLPGGGSTTEQFAYGTHGAGKSYWTASWQTTPKISGTVNYVVTVKTLPVPAVRKTVNGKTKVVTQAIPSYTGTFSSTQLAGMPDQALVVGATATSPTVPS